MTIFDEVQASIARLAEEFNPIRLAAIEEVHTSAGKHKVITTPFPKWVPKDVRRAAKKLNREEAAQLIHDTSSAKPNGIKRQR
jgi:hypothetical protein